MDYRNSKIPYWKDVWSLIYGRNKNATNENIAEKLDQISGSLLKGFSYDKYEYNSLLLLQENLKLSNEFWSLIKRVCELLNINAKDGWDILCHYLKNGFHGGPNSLNIKIETHVVTTEFLQNVWHFYYLERMYHLKTIKLILEFHTNEDYPYYKELDKLLFDLNVENVRKWLITQFRQLIMSRISECDDMTRSMKVVWIDHNISEQVEILQCLLLTHDLLTITPEEFLQLMKLFEAHAFGQHGTYDQYLIQRQKSLCDNVSCHEIALVLCILDHVKMNDYSNVWSEEAIESIKHWPGNFMLHCYPASAPMSVLWYARMFPESDRFPPNITTAVEYVHCLIKQRIFQEDTTWVKLVIESVFHWLMLISTKKDIHYLSKSFAQCWEVVLQYREIANLFFEEHDSESCYAHISDVLTEAKIMFPRSFELFTRIMKGLIVSSSENLCKAVSITRKLPVFTVMYEQVYPSIVSQGDRGYFKTDWHHLHLFFGIIKSHTQLLLREHHYMTPTAHIFINYSYWELLEKLIDATKEEIMQNKPIRKVVIQGLEFLYVLLNKMYFSKSVPKEFSNLIVKVMELLDTMVKRKSVDTDCFAACIQTITALKDCVPKELYKDLINLQLFPKFITERSDFSELIIPENFNQGILYNLIVEHELSNKKYNLIVAYLNFIRLNFFETNSNDLLRWKIPGVIFITRVIFPKIQESKIRVDSAEQDIFKACIDLIYIVLRMPEQLIRTRTNYKLMQKLCYYEMIHPNNCKLLVNFIMFGDNNLEIIMMNEADWFNGAGIAYIDIIQTCMSILLFMLNLKSSLFHGNISELTPLEMLLFNSPNKEYIVSFIRSIATYVRHSFNRLLPTMACRVLQIFAENSDFSLNSCFKLDMQEIQYTFIYPLRNRAESDNFKICLLQFITACIPRQPALTQSFFYRDTCEEESEEDNSLLGLMEECLCFIKAKVGYITHPIVHCIIGLFHQLWKYGKQAVVSDITSKPNFWPSLWHPLFDDVLIDIKTYPLIFNILTIEIYEKKDDLNEHLKKLMLSFFDMKNIYIKLWIVYIYDTNLQYDSDVRPSPEIIPDWLRLLQAWKDYLTVCMNHCSSMFEESTVCYIAENCFTAFINEVTLSNDIRPIVSLAETYLKLLCQWKQKIILDPKKLLNLILKLVSFISDKYDTWSNRAKMSVLALVMLCIDLLQDELENEPILAIDIFENVCHMTRESLYAIESRIADVNISKSESSVEKIKENLLLLRLLQVCMNTVDKQSEFVNWCHQKKLCASLTKSLANVIQNYSELLTSITIIDLIIMLMKTDCGLDFVNENISVLLWEKFVPPSEFQPKSNINPNKNIWKLQDWWKVYSKIIKMLVIWLQYHGVLVLQDVFSFILFHEAYLIDCLVISKTTMDIEALDICLATVSLVGALLKYKQDWCVFHSNSFKNIIRALLMCIHHCIAVLLRPMVILNKINADELILTSENQKSSPPAILVTVINKFIDIIYRVSQTLTLISPSIFNLIMSIDFNPEHHLILLDTSYTIPKLIDEDTMPICFGTLLSIVNLFSRSLSYTLLKSKSFPRTSAQDTHTIRPPSKTDLKLSQMWASKWENSSIIAPYQTVYRHSSDFPAIDVYPRSPFNLMSETWLGLFNEDNTFKALESVLYLLTSQAILIVKQSNTSTKDKLHTFRELHSEISVFHELMQKLTKGWRLEKVMKSFSPYSEIERQKQGTEVLCNKYNVNNSSDEKSSEPYNKLIRHKLDVLIFINNIFIKMVDEDEINYLC